MKTLAVINRCGEESVVTPLIIITYICTPLLNIHINWFDMDYYIFNPSQLKRLILICILFGGSCIFKNNIIAHYESVHYFYFAQRM